MDASAEARGAFLPRDEVLGDAADAFAIVAVSLLMWMRSCEDEGRNEEAKVANPFPLLEILERAAAARDDIEVQVVSRSLGAGAIDVLRSAHFCHPHKAS